MSIHRSWVSFFAVFFGLSIFVSAARADVPAVLDHGNCASPTVDVGSDGLARIAWTSDESGSPRVRWGAFDRGGTCVQGPVEVSTAGGFAYRPRLALDSQNRSFLVWVVGAGTINQLHFARVGADGSIEVPETNVSLGNDGFQGIDIDTTPEGYTHLITEHNESLHHPINYSLLSREGVPLGGSPLELADQNWFFDVDSYPALSIGPDGRVDLTWFDRGSTSPTVSLYGARYTPLGSRESWQRLVYDVAPGQATVAKPTVDDLWILFGGRVSGVDRILKYESIDNTSIVSLSSGPTVRPRVVGMPGHPVVAVWEDRSTGTARVRRAEFESSGAPLLEDGVVSESSGAATAPDIGMNAEGLAYVAWVDTRHGRNDLYMTSFVGGDSSPWPYNPGPSMTFRVESQNENVALLRLSGEPPTQAKTATPSAKDVFVDPITVPVVDGFAKIESSRLADMPEAGDYDRVDLLRLDGTLIGHIGLEYDDDDASAAISLNAYVFLHDELPAVDTSEHEYWGYYEPGEYQVSMLVPPQSRFSAIGGAPKRPVLFMHGIEGYFRDWHDWENTPDRVDPSRFDVWRFYYPYDQPIADSAGLLGKALERLQGDTDARLFGCSPYTHGIDIVAHSMGGLVARAHLQSAENHGRVRKLMMVGTPNHGSYVSHRIRWSAQYGNTILAAVLDALQLTDPWAPAHLDMAPASPFLMELNGRPPVRLGTPSIATDYLVVAGFNGALPTPLGIDSNPPHREIHKQSDGVVSVSSASLRQHGIPLALVDEDHQRLMWDRDPERLIEGFLEDDYAQGSFACYLQPQDPLDCADDEGVNIRDGIVQLHIPQTFAASGGRDEPVDVYRVEAWEGDTPLLRLHANDDVGREEPSLVRALSGQDDYFSRTLNNWTQLKEIGLRADAASYQVHVLREVFVGEDDPWVTVGRSAERISFAPLQSTVDSLTSESTSDLAFAAPHWAGSSSSARAVDASTFEVDADMDWIVFNLDTVVPVLDFSGHGLELEDPTGRLIDPSTAAADPLIQFTAFDEFGPVQYTVTTPEPGTWTVRHEDTLPGARVTMFYDAGFRAVSRFVDASVAEGDSLEFLLTISGAEGCASQTLDARLDFTPAATGTPEPTVSLPLNEVSVGEYRGLIPSAARGSYFVSVTAVCDDGAGTVLVRVGGASAGVQVSPDDATAVAESPPAPRQPWLEVHPNPFNATTQFSFEVSATSRARLTVYTVGGQRVVTLLDRTVGPGTRYVTWNGMDSRGRPVATGVYLGRVEVDGMVGTKKVLLLK